MKAVTVVFVALLAGALGAAPAPQPKPQSQPQPLLCVVPAKVDSTGSALSVSGNIARPFTATVAPTNRASFGGQVFLVFPQDKCPTAANLAAALNKAYLGAPKNATGVVVGQAAAVVKINDFEAATLTLEGLRGTLASKPGPAGVSSPNVTATGGLLVTKSPLANMNPYPLTGSSLSMSGSSCSLAAATNGSLVVFSCPKVKVANDFSLEAGSGTLSLAGSLNAVGRLADAKLVPASDLAGPAPAN